MKLLHQIAQQNDYEGFKKALIDELGFKSYRKLRNVFELSIRKTSIPDLTLEEDMQRTAENLINVAVNRFKLDRNILATKSNKRKYVYPRTVIMMILYEHYPECRYATLASVFNRNHDFVNNCQSRHEAVKDYEDYNAIYQILKTYI